MKTYTADEVAEMILNGLEKQPTANFLENEFEAYICGDPGCYSEQMILREIKELFIY